MRAVDYVLIGVLVFVFAIAFFIGKFAMSTVSDAITSIPTIAGHQEVVDALEDTDETMGRADYVIFGLFIGLVLAMIVGSYFMASHPILMFVYIIVVVISVIAGAFMSNAWETTTQLSVFGSTISEFPISNNLLSYLPFYNAVVGIIGIIIMFAKYNREGGY